MGDIKIKSVKDGKEVTKDRMYSLMLIMLNILEACKIPETKSDLSKFVADEIRDWYLE